MTFKLGTKDPQEAGRLLRSMKRLSGLRYSQLWIDTEPGGEYLVFSRVHEQIEKTIETSILPEARKDVMLAMEKSARRRAERNKRRTR